MDLLQSASHQAYHLKGFLSGPHPQGTSHLSHPSATEQLSMRLWLYIYMLHKINSCADQTLAEIAEGLQGTLKVRTGLATLAQ